ncbi:hypothetical protein [Flavobacterium reichenbachii]|uniref:Uncharacterized protein n=1 Tax=Flavobacterium reichenbachii TaxID=362418 RepID=A0A085ZI01_9FLAO|nr:hypothetical protein [Flavobacterium reichenbachii]KFF04065.1 hypothetical protein IW19_00305 [Flavobacterium reichenbachii]OXB12883.1 hypothetical protein B0A68_17105 [Flavobacterium reichenbachii]
MKRLLLILGVVSLWSCSNDEQVQTTQANTQNSLSVLDGKLLSFKDDESFIKEYIGLSELNTDKLKSWDSSKKFTALLSVSDDLFEIEGDIVPVSRLVYSDALKALLSSESKLMIGGKVLWLNGRNFYLLGKNDLNKTSDELVSSKDSFDVYGQLLSLSGSSKSLTSRNVIPNENRTITFASDEMNVNGSRLRHVLDLFNETIVLNDQIKTSKMYLRNTLQYRSCSTFRCTWKEAMNVRTLSTANLYCASCSNGSVAPWSLFTINDYGMTGTQTYLLANWSLQYPLANPYANFAVSGFVTSQVEGVTFSIPISWY